MTMLSAKVLLRQRHRDGCVLAAFILPCLLLAGGCRHAPTPGAERQAICYVGTEAYQQKVKGFKVPLDQARRLLATQLEHFDRQQPQREPRAVAFVGNHTLIIGEAYHFYLPNKTGGIPRTGYYVDGQTGAVEFRVVEGAIPYLPSK